MSPAISVCIPTFNGQDTLAEAVRSVLNQTVDLELILCDGGSVDNTVNLIRSFNDSRVVFVDNRAAQNAEENWNRAVAASSAPFVKVMGQDDILLPDCLATELAVMTQSSSSTVAFCYSKRLLNVAGKHLGKRREFESNSTQIVESNQLLQTIVRSGRNPVGEPVAVTIRRTCFDAAGGYRGSYVIDLDLYVRMLRYGKAARISATLSVFRVSGSSWSYRLRKSQATEVRNLHKRIRNDMGVRIGRFAYVIGFVFAGLFPVVRIIVMWCSKYLERIVRTQR